jgi:hypothetical protein
MSRVFSIRIVLRQTPNRLTRQFLARLGHLDLEIPWDELGERDIEPIVDALNTLTGPEFDAVEGVLHAVFDLACATGVAAVREMRACLNDGELGELPQDAGLYEQVMWAWIHWPDAVEQALLIHQIDRLNWWRRRNDLPQRPPDTSPDTLARLGREISSLLRQAEGRGRNCTVEAFARRGTTCYFAFPDDFVLNVTAHDDDGHLAPRTFRRTFTMVFAYDPLEGSLELYAKVGAGLKLELERLFAQVVSGIELGEWRPEAAYEPNALRDRGFRMETDPEDNVSVDVRQIRLSFVNGARQIILRGDPARVGDVFRMIDEVLDAENVRPSAVNVTLITFCFEFHPVGRRRGGSVTFDVAFPNSCSLRNQRPERVAVIMKYLTRWGINVTRPSGPHLGAA